MASMTPATPKIACSHEGQHQRVPVPIGYVWHREIGLGLDPDRRVQEVPRRIFQGFRELGRQVHLALKVEGCTSRAPPTARE